MKRAAAATTITTTTLMTYIHSIVPDSVKDQLDVESINTTGYICTDIYMYQLCVSICHTVLKK